MRYTDNGDGTITDNKTGLMWQKKPDKNKLTWHKAKKYCTKLALAGYENWRMPTIEELLAIVDHGRCDPAIDSMFGVMLCGYWSCTPWVCSPTNYWYIHFYYGGHGTYHKSHCYYVRAVRTVRGRDMKGDIKCVNTDKLIKQNKKLIRSLKRFVVGLRHNVLYGLTNMENDLRYAEVILEELEDLK